jgi:hypothetical protein
MSNKGKSFDTSLDEIIAKIESKRREKQAYYDDIPQKREDRIKKAYEYLMWQEKHTISQSAHKYDVSEKQLLETRPGMTRTQQAYEYYRKHPVSMRKAGEKFGVSHASISQHKSELEGKLTSRTERKFLHSEHSNIKILHGYRCYMCLDVFEPQDLEIDHWDGDRTNDAWGNRVPLCKKCHAKKTHGKVYKRSIAFIQGKPVVGIEEVKE